MAHSGELMPRDDWTVQAADTIESLVGSIRDKTATPLTTAARAVVYGLLAAIMGVTAAVLLAIGLVRFTNSYLPGDVWAAHALVGGIFTLAGLFSWSKRHPKSEE